METGAVNNSDSDAEVEVMKVTEEPTTLHAAAKKGCVSAVQRLLAQGASPNAKGADGTTPLYIAAQEGHMGVIAELLRAGVHCDLAAVDRRRLQRRAAPSAPGRLITPGQKAKRRLREWNQAMEFSAIDIAPFVEPEKYDESARLHTARAWDETFRSVGFALIEGHGVSDEMIRKLRKQARAFFNRASHYKNGFYKGGTDTGFSARGANGQSGGHNDPLEGYTFMRTKNWNRSYGHPSELAEIGPQYCGEVERVMHALHKLSAMALGLDQEYFDRFYTSPASVVVVSHYPPTNDEPDTKLRYRAHSDYSGFTVLLQDDGDNVEGAGGLEIDVNDTWVPVRPRKGCFVVNIGDLFETWTNDRWRSTPHRVKAPIPGSKAAEQSRITAMLFSGPNLDSLIEPIRTCVDKDHPAQYIPILARDHLAGQWMSKSKEAGYKEVADKSAVPAEEKRD